MPSGVKPPFETAWSMTPSRSVAAWPVLVAALWACAPPGGGAAGDVEVSSFAEDAVVSGRVLENSTACEVDAVCYLRIEFADTSIVALYGTGERPAPACEISRGVSDVAFGVSPDEVITVVVSRCGSDGYYLRQLREGSAGEGRD